METSAFSLIMDFLNLRRIFRWNVTLFLVHTNLIELNPIEGLDEKPDCECGSDDWDSCQKNKDD